MNIINNIFTGIWIVFALYWLVSAASSKRSIRNGRWAKNILVRLAIFFIVLVIVSLPGAKEYLSFVTVRFSGVVRIFGLFVVAFGIGFAIWARRHLGRNWGMPMSLKADPELVTSGPYELVRNPIYSGMLLALLGSALVEGLGWIILFVLFGIYFAYASKAEEKIMLAAFPATYPAYKARTKMLIPFVF